jgi:hypothetical protein
MEGLEGKILKLKEIFPAGERHVLEYAARMTSKSEATEYLKQIYGNPVGQKSAWAKPLQVSQPIRPSTAKQDSDEVHSKRNPFSLSLFKVKECKSRTGCTCDNFHHEFEKRRNPEKFHYSEIPCPNVFKGQWKAPILCSKGDKCGHSHTVNEASYHPRTFKTKKCLKFEEGSCHFGMRCAYIHGSDDPVAADWRREQEEKSRPKVSVPIDFTPKINLSSLVPTKEVNSSLSPAAWTFTPTEKIKAEDKITELNQRMQKRIEELYTKTLCSICFVNEKNVALVPCGHLFCLKCIDQTFTAVCPNCRRDFKDKLLVFL